MSHSHVETVTEKARFDAIVRSAGSKVVVDFSAAWCGPCQAIGPVFDALAGKHTGAVKCLKVDVDEMRELAEELDVTSMPTFVFLKDGREVKRVVGASRSQLEIAFSDLSSATSDDPFEPQPFGGFR